MEIVRCAGHLSLNSSLSIFNPSHFHYLLADLPSANETNGYIFIHAEGGLNQQRIAVSFDSQINFISFGFVVCLNLSCIYYLAF